MANPTIQILVDRARGVLNEKYPNAWTNDDPVLLGFIATGLQEEHARMKARLGGRKPPIASPYWRNFLKRTTLVPTEGNQEVALPSDFDILASVTDTFTDQPLEPFDEGDEIIYKRGHVWGVNHQGSGYYTFAPGNKLRVLLWPGVEGIPGPLHQLIFRYWSHMPRYTLLTDVIILPHEFTDSAVWFAICKGYARFRDSPMEAYSLFKENIAAQQ